MSETTFVLYDVVIRVQVASYIAVDNMSNNLKHTNVSDTGL